MKGKFQNESAGISKNTSTFILIFILNNDLYINCHD